MWHDQTSGARIWIFLYNVSTQELFKKEEFGTESV